MPDFATFRDFAMPENSGIFRRNFPLEKMPPNPALNLGLEAGLETEAGPRDKWCGPDRPPAVQYRHFGGGTGPVQG